MSRSYLQCLHQFDCWSRPKRARHFFWFKHSEEKNGNEFFTEEFCIFSFFLNSYQRCQSMVDRVFFLWCYASSSHHNYPWPTIQDTIACAEVVHFVPYRNISVEHRDRVRATERKHFKSLSFFSFRWIKKTNFSSKNLIDRCTFTQCTFLNNLRSLFFHEQHKRIQRLFYVRFFRWWFIGIFSILWRTFSCWTWPFWWWKSVGKRTCSSPKNQLFCSIESIFISHHEFEFETE